LLAPKQKVPFEVICLADPVHGKCRQAYLCSAATTELLNGLGSALRDFTDHLRPEYAALWKHATVLDLPHAAKAAEALATNAVIITHTEDPDRADVRGWATTTSSAPITRVVTVCNTISPQIPIGRKPDTE
jgi:hypothetical protein